MLQLAIVSLSSITVQPQPETSSLGSLAIECPGVTKIACHDSTDPSVTGTPTTSGECDPAIPATLTYSDSIVIPPCPAQRFDETILRTWTATDSCGNTATCDQTIHVVKQIWSFDIKAQSCPNPFNLGANGMISMTLVGSAQSDVTTIDPSTIQIWTTGCQGGPVVPVRYHYEDKATPWPGGPACGCHTLGTDGFLDLDFHFRRADVENGLHLGTYPPFSYVRIFVTAQTQDGCGILGTDCVRVQ